MQAPKKFHFFSYRYAIRFHISRRLQALGWQQSTAAEALFSDKNLTLNDDISLYLEYKHLLAKLTHQYCPEVMPLTYCINENNAPFVFAKIIYDNYMQHNQYVLNIEGLKWILKPSMLNNGDEISLFNNIEELKKHYTKKNRLGGEHVIQRYLPNPALINGKKYTFRMPVILTNYAGVFIYNQGYINISNYVFNLEDGFNNRKVHMTNYVLDGEFAHIEQRSTQTLQNFSEIFQQMQNIVSVVIKSLLKIAPHYLKFNGTKIFEIFGFDFILDQQGKVWLLEINQGPDMPTFEDNCLTDILWENFWQDIINHFVLPIALNKKNNLKEAQITSCLTIKQTYSYWQYLWSRLYCNKNKL